MHKNISDILTKPLLQPIFSKPSAALGLAASWRGYVRCYNLLVHSAVSSIIHLALYLVAPLHLATCLLIVLYNLVVLGCASSGQPFFLSILTPSMCAKSIHLDLNNVLVCRVSGEGPPHLQWEGTGQQPK